MTNLLAWRDCNHRFEWYCPKADRILLEPKAPCVLFCLACHHVFGRFDKKVSRR